MMNRLFGIRNGAPSPLTAASRGFGAGNSNHDLMKIGMILLGRENSGKSALLTSLDLAWMSSSLASGLQMNLVGSDGVELSPLVLASRMEKIQRRLWALSEDGDGLKSTVVPEPVNYCLCEGSSPRLQLNTDDEIGQIISHTKSESSADEMKRYEAFLKRLSERDVITMVFSPPPRTAHAMADFQWTKDLKMYAAYLTEGLRKGDRRKPVSVAILINKVDTLFDDEQAARAALTDSLLRASFETLIQVIDHEPRIVNAAIFPVSAFGFGNAVARKAGPEAAAQANQENRPWQVTTRGGLEQEYGIQDGRSIEPFNLQSVILWSLLAAALPKEIDMPHDRGVEPALVRTCRMLREDLTAQNGWFVPLKKYQA